MCFWQLLADGCTLVKCKAFASHEATNPVNGALKLLSGLAGFTGELVRFDMDKFRRHLLETETTLVDKIRHLIFKLRVHCMTLAKGCLPLVAHRKVAFLHCQ